MKLFFIIILASLSLKLQSQSLERSVIGTAGSSFTNTNLSLDWTVGEISTSTLSAGNSLLTQGFHQPPQSTLSVKNTKLLTGVTCFPNPVQNDLCIKYTQLITDSKIELFDATGKLVFSENHNATQEHHLNMSFYTSGIYTLKICVGNECNTFRVSKV